MRMQMMMMFPQNSSSLLFSLILSLLHKLLLILSRLLSPISSSFDLIRTTLCLSTSTLPSNPALLFSSALLTVLLGLVKSTTFSPWPHGGILLVELLLMLHSLMWLDKPHGTCMIDKHNHLSLSSFIKTCSSIFKRMHMLQQGALHTLLLWKISGINWQLSSLWSMLPTLPGECGEQREWG